MVSNIEEVNEIKNWLVSQPEIQKLSDEEIRIFLHSCYCKIDDTQKCIQAYHSARGELPEVFTNRDPTAAQVQNFLKCFQIMLPDEKTDENYSVIIIRASNPAPELFDTASFYKTYFMTVDSLILENPYCEGVLLVFDVSGCTFSHLRKVNFGIMRRCTKYLEEGMPIRTKGLHLINLTYTMMKIIQLAKTFVKTDRSDIAKYKYGNIAPHAITPKPPAFEIAETKFLSETQLIAPPIVENLLRQASAVTKCSSNLETLHDAIPKRCLPEEYGGTSGPSEELNEKNIERLIKHRDFFMGEKGTPFAENMIQSGHGKSTTEDGLSMEKLNTE